MQHFYTISIQIQRNVKLLVFAKPQDFLKMHRGL